MFAFEDLITNLQDCMITEDKITDHVRQRLKLFFQKLSEASRSSVKRCKERCLEEAAQLLRPLSATELHLLKERHVLLLVRVLISLQLQMGNSSTASRKVDQMLKHLSNMNHQLVFREIHHCLSSITQTDQTLSMEDLQRVCMFLEESSVACEVWRVSYMSLLNKLAELFPVVLREEDLRDGPLCYISVKVCLQIFQLLSNELAPFVWRMEHRSPTLETILQALMDIILGQCCSRDSRLLAGTAVAMLVNTAPESRAGGDAAWSLLQVSDTEPWLLIVGGLQVHCRPIVKDRLDRVAVSRGLLTCCRSDILVGSRVGTTEKYLLLNGLFPLVYGLCEEKLNCYAFEVLTLWLKKVKECLSDIWKLSGVHLLSDNGCLQRQLIHIIWTNAESPVEGVSEFVHSAFCVLLELYEMECKQFGDQKKTLYSALLQRVANLPWKAKAKYYHLCALLPYLGVDPVLDQYAELPNHLLKCLSTNHLSPCASELYKCLIRQQRQELCDSSNGAAPTELDLANQWVRRWSALLLEGLTSDVMLLQNNCSTQLLPCTFHVFPSAVVPLLASLDTAVHGHLHAWACIMSSHRATVGDSTWALQGSSAFETLHLALGSCDDKVRLAALNLLCYSPKTKAGPTPEEMSVMRMFIPQNLNCESSPFRQHFQAAVKRFLVRIRDSCLAHLRSQKSKMNGDPIYSEMAKDSLDHGIGFVEWLSKLPYCYLSAGHNYQRKKTVLLLLSALLETCTDTWTPDKKKGQPPASIGCLINYARQRGQWNFFSREKQLVLLTCLEDSTNEIREISAALLLRYFPPSLPDDIAAVLLTRIKERLCSPRVQEAQMSAIMMKVFLQKTHEFGDCSLNSRVTVSGSSNPEASSVIRFLVKELEAHYLTAKADMMLSARTKPIHGVLGTIHRCLLEAPTSVCDTLDQSMVTEILDLLANISSLLLGVLYGDRGTCASVRDAPPSFCDMGKAITSLIAEASAGNQEDTEDSILLSEEHSLVLTCCWVSLKEIGILIGSLVEKILSDSKPNLCLLTLEDLIKASKIFKDILLKCRHWGAVEGCCTGFTKFCASLLNTNDPELKVIPAHMLQQGLQVLQSPPSTSVTRRAAGLPMLILCIVSAEEASKSRPLLTNSIHVLLKTARTPLPQSWDQTLDLTQVCAVHTLQVLMRGSGLGVAVLHFAPAVAVLSLTLLSSPCWAMRNAALQLYSSLCSRMLGQSPRGEDGGPTQHGMSPVAFFFHYPGLQSFLLDELRGAAKDLQVPPDDAKLRLQPSLYPVLTLLAQLQPGVPDSSESLSDFFAPLLQLSASPIYNVRVMASKALVAMLPPSKYMSILTQLTAELPSPQEHCCHNRLHGQLLQIRALVERTLCTDSPQSVNLCEVVSRVESSLWLATGAQRCPLVRAAYLEVASSLRSFCCEVYLDTLSNTLKCELCTPQQGLQVGLASFQQKAIQFLCADQKWAYQMWDSFSTVSPDLRLALFTWVINGRGLLQSSLKQAIQGVLQSNLKEALRSRSLEYRRNYLTAMVAVMTEGDWTSLHHPCQSLALDVPVLLDCLDLLLVILEDQAGGPEFLSQSLYAASLLLARCSHSSLQSSTCQRWCSILEGRRSPVVPEVLRLACAEALCLAGVVLMRLSLTEKSFLLTVKIRLIDTGLYLLQDQNQEVRMKAACFASILHHERRGEGQSSLYLMQVNQAVPILLDLLLEECWDTPATLELLLSHLPQSDLQFILRGPSEESFMSLYEQDEANVFAEPSVMCTHILPYLLQMAEKYSESSALACCMDVWAEESAAQILDSLALCKDSQPAANLTHAWTAVLVDPRFHIALCGLFTRAAFLLRLLQTADDVGPLCDPSTLHQSLLEVFSLLCQSGVHLPSAFTATVTWKGAIMADRECCTLSEQS
ncbi:thyroid adenoma-associated protein homolog [Thalassophryne amazonica]|uniref:thyroid adenoma-associated protein homolog n=1 Tax=Thalassophryne amazonica TaxID=390379 RepID=UPI001470918E|nr:thyroid adenoma-associated protein homolog [Thalassophryne amazonica]